MTDLEYEIIQLELQVYLIEHNAKLLDYHITDVLNELKAAIGRGDKDFTFPTVDELTGTEISKMTA